MPKPIENVSTELFDFLKNRFDLSEGVDENGNPTSNPEDMKVFAFDFVNKTGKDCGCVVMSLLDDSESSNSLKIYFGQELSDSETGTRNDWFEFLKEARQFAKMHVLGFDIRNINKSRITKRDIEPMFESTFGPIDGTIKTSRQPLDGVQIVIKHSDKINLKIKNSRSRRISKIYLTTDKGERFLMPFKSLQAARVMARHLSVGGTPYDAIGSDICHLVDEMFSLRRFVRNMKNKEFQDPRAAEAIESAHARYLEIKKQLSSMTTSGGYAKVSTTMDGTNKELEDEEYDNMFGDEPLEEDFENALPHVMRAFSRRKKMPEENEFEKWVSASKGEGEGQEMLADDEAEPVIEESKKPKCPKCGSTKYALMPTDFETAKCSKCGKNWDHGIVDGINNPHDLKEADAPCSAGWGSPLSFPNTKVPPHFHTPKEINKMKDTSGALSPLSLLNSKEQTEDDDETDMQRILHLSGHRRIHDREK